jgi:hypothetical protein
LRSAPCYDSNVLKTYDVIIRSTLQSILNVALTDDAWAQAKLPVKFGGLGVLAASEVALPAFIASVIGTADLTSSLLPPALRCLTGQYDHDVVQYIDQWKLITNKMPPDVSVANQQKQWSQPLQIMAADIAMAAATNPTSRARLIAAAAPGSGAFLQTVPMASVGTRLDNCAVHIAVALRLGATVCVPHQCICGVMVDSTGVHGLSCRKSAGRTSRHAAINGIIKAALTTAEVPSRLEPRGLARDDGKQPDGVTSVPWQEGRCLMWDVTCPDTLASSYVAKAVTGPGAVATDAEARKRQKYQAIDHAVYKFQPVAIETLGAYGEDSWDFIQQLGRRLRTVTRDTRSASYLLHRLSVAVQRGNAACILGTIADNEGQMDNFAV